MSNLSHRELVDIGAKWLNMKAENINTRCHYVLTEFVCAGQNENPDIFGLNPNHHVLIEVKISRNDFKVDSKKKGRNKQLLQIGNYRYFLVPKNLIKEDELPDGWGLVFCDGKNVEVIKKSKWFTSDSKKEGYIYHSILRRLHKPQIFNFRKQI